MYSIDHGLRTPGEEITFTARPKFTPTPRFFGTAEAYFVCHISPNFQVSLIYAFIGCPYFVIASIALAHSPHSCSWLTSTNDKGKWVPKGAREHLKFLSAEKGFFKWSRSSSSSTSSSGKEKKSSNL